MLSLETMAEVDGCQVDPAVGRHDNGNFLFLNLANCEPKFRIPPSERRRVNREKLRAVLLNEVKDHVQWSKRLSSVSADDTNQQGSVTAHFDDGTSATGSMIIGADGSNSHVRKMLRPDAYRNDQLPIRFVGSGIDMTPEQVAPLRSLDPLLFQGCHPDTGCFMWVSMLEVPETNGTANSDHERYRVQINLSWPVKSPDDEVKADNAERLADMKRRASVFAPTLRNAVGAIPENTPVLEIKLADWPCLDWDNRGGRITLLGDAAHAMTMFRGEAANHGMLDAYRLCESIRQIHTGSQSQEDAISGFEAEMRTRTSHAVQMSRQACFDAHDWERLNENSAVLTKRAVVAK
jgi:2-polyprenyl-6-methoxyphenol hydroxylase-like FAD-dependent oxidoreductase